MAINWITPNLGTGPFGVDDVPFGSVCIDIRNLVDRRGNSPAMLVEQMNRALLALEQGRCVIICCDHGISRSNALAAAVLSKHENVPISEGIRRVLAATQNAEIRVELLDSVRTILDAGGPPAGRSVRQRWLLTGSHGYLGSSLAKSVPANVELVCPSHAELNLSEGGIALDLFVRENQVSRILHFAAPPIGNINSSLGESLVSLRNVLDTCVSNSLPLVLPSRWEVFSGYRGIDLDADEATPRKASGVLGDTKFLSEMLVQAFVEREGIQVLLLRSALVYGGASAPNFMRSFIQRALVGERLITHIYNNGEPKLDLLYIDDWTRACWALLQSQLEGVFHCGSGDPVSTSEVARIILRSVNGNGDISSVQILDGVANVALNSRKLRDAVGWRPTVELECGVSTFANARCPV